MDRIRDVVLGLLVTFTAMAAANFPAIAQQQQRPNIVVIMGDDIGRISSARS
jgi:hypothetical protein